MSLHTLANHLQSAGRGDDKVLVHMTPKEVSGLQALAMAHGGSLTVNPHTGLPEAGFLSAILPMIAGLALGPAGFGIVESALGAGALVGGVTGLATGSLKQGLMAGLGAYGGAGLGQGLSTIGASTPTQAFPLTPPTPAPVVPEGGLFPSDVSSKFLTATNPEAIAATATPTTAAPAASGPFSSLSSGVRALGQPGGFTALYNAMPQGSVMATGASLLSAAQPDPLKAKKDNSMIRPYTFSREVNPGVFDKGQPIYSDTPGSSAEKQYFTDSYTALTPYKAPGPEYKAADGGLVAFGIGGPVEQMSAQNAVGDNQMYPQAGLQTAMYSNPMMQRPMANNVIQSGVDTNVDRYTGEERFAAGGTADPSKSPGYQYSYNPNTMEFTQVSKPVQVSTASTGPVAVGGRTQDVWESQPTNIVTGGMMQPAGMQAPSSYQPYQMPAPAYQSPEQQMGMGSFYDDMHAQLGAMGYAGGGISTLGGYSDGGHLLRGPGDGVSDSIPASIGDRQPARLADGEFVVPARIVSELGNGSTEAGARKLYAMMDRVQKARGKSVGKDKVAVDSKTEKYLPA